MRLSKAQQRERMDLDVIAASGHDLNKAREFFRKHNISISRHPQHGWQFTSVLAGNEHSCAFWQASAGHVSLFIEWLDAPSQIIKARDEAQQRILARA